MSVMSESDSGARGVHVSHKGIADHPLIKRINELAGIVAKVRLMVLHPSEDGWREIRPESPVSLPDFCRTIQSTSEGARNCRMCHVLMTVSACTEGLTEHQCHAGASVMVAPASQRSGSSFAALTSCAYHGAEGMEIARSRAKALGLSPKTVEKAYKALPRLSPHEKNQLMRIVEICAMAAREIEEVEDLKAENRRMADGDNQISRLASVVKDRLRSGVPTTSKGAAPGTSSSSALIRVLTSIVDDHPYLPFSQKELAAVSRITPNYLSQLFHRHTGKRFSEYLADRRLSMAKELLSDLTLSIAEVARRVGYDDPGYFARRFCRKIGMAPREWREAGAPRGTPPQTAGRNRTVEKSSTA